MKIATCRNYGGPEVVQLEQAPKPVPKPKEILVKVCATTVETGDMRVRGLKGPFAMRCIIRLMFGFTAPRHPVLGFALSGIVEDVGKDVCRFKVGDKIFAETVGGGHAEYAVLAEDSPIALKPKNLSLAECAALPFGTATAQTFISRANIRPGERVLIEGASGAVGCAAIQLVKNLGAHVTAVCSSPNHELVRGLGANEVIDYNHQDFTKSETKYDVVMDNVGTAPWNRSKSALNDNGRLLLVVTNSLSEMMQSSKKEKGKRVVVTVTETTAPVLQEIKDMVEKDALKPVIGKRFAFENIKDAHAYVDTGHKRGTALVIVDASLDN